MPCYCWSLLNLTFPHSRWVKSEQSRPYYVLLFLGLYTWLVSSHESVMVCFISVYICFLLSQLYFQRHSLADWLVWSYTRIKITAEPILLSANRMGGVHGFSEALGNGDTQPCGQGQHVKWLQRCLIKIRLKIVHLSSLKHNCPKTNLTVKWWAIEATQNACSWPD